MKSKSLSVILPTLNEAQNITPLVYKIVSLINPDEILIIDDNSNDGTGGSARKLSLEYPSVFVTVNDPPLGLAASIQKGIDLSSSDYVAWMDADFSHPPETLLKMINKITSCDLVIGSWNKRGGKDKRKERLTRLLSFAVNKTCRLLFYNRITAYTSGFILVKKQIIKEYSLKGDYGEYCIDLLVRLSARGYKIKEEPFKCVSRIKGQSKTSPNLYVYFKKGLGYLIMIVSLYSFFLGKNN